jgi:hypothetical protein
MSEQGSDAPHAFSHSRAMAITHPPCCIIAIRLYAHSSILLPFPARSPKQWHRLRLLICQLLTILIIITTHQPSLALISHRVLTNMTCLGPGLILLLRPFRAIRRVTELCLVSILIFSTAAFHAQPARARQIRSGATRCPLPTSPTVNLLSDASTILENPRAASQSSPDSRKASSQD